MASVTGFTAARMKAIEDSCIVGGAVLFDTLMLMQRNGTQINAGNVRGPQGVPGTPGATGDKGDKGDKGDTGLKGDSSTPAGTILVWPGDTAPVNWLLCDGSAVSRTTYASLFSAIGTRYGVGDGSTTFNLPNLKGKTLVGLDVAQTEFNALGKAGGEKTHLLTTAEMPAHTHIQDSHGHNLNNGTVASAGHLHGLAAGWADIFLAASSSNQIGMRRIATGAWTPTLSLTPSATPAATFTTTETVGAALGGSTDSNTDTTTVSVIGNTATNQNTGGGGAHNNLQPYSVVNFIIKHSNGDTAGDSQLTQRVSALETLASPTAFSLRDRMAALKQVLTGGGIRKATATDVTWTERFIMIGSGNDANMPSGYFEILVPPNGTVIPVIGNSTITSVTVANGKIPVPNSWCALYYDVPLGQTLASVPGNFHWVDFRVPISQIPSTWVLVIVQNTDASSPLYTWGDGRQQDVWKPMTMSNGWVAFASPHAIPAWKFTGDGKIKVKGLIKGGTANSSSAAPAYAFPTGYGPVETELFVQPSNNDGSCRVDVLNNGGLVVYAFYGTGSNAWVSLAGIEWYPSDL